MTFLRVSSNAWGLHYGLCQRNLGLSSQKDKSDVRTLVVVLEISRFQFLMEDTSPPWATSALRTSIVHFFAVTIGTLGARLERGGSVGGGEGQRKGEGETCVGGGGHRAFRVKGSLIPPKPFLSCVLCVVSSAFSLLMLFINILLLISLARDTPSSNQSLPSS